MAKTKYLTAPVPSDKMPSGIKYIVGNEAAERFSYYGMKTILIVFMTTYLMGETGPDPMAHEEAMFWYHTFGSAVYFFPLLGSVVADLFFGKYKTIMSLSVVYCLGHLALALDESRMGLAIGLTLIAIGSGGIKPCVSAHVGDQFGKRNQALLEKVFGYFYFAINLGAFASTMLTPVLLVTAGPGLAFGVPGILMFLATVVFWFGRNKYVHIPAGGKEFLKETFSGEGLRAVGKLAIIYMFVAMFWALFDQTGSAWVLQAQEMDREFLGIVWLPSQIQAINPILIMVFIPIFNFIIYPGLNKLFKLTPLKKISIGLFITVPAFLIPAWIETQLQSGVQVNIAWQLLAYVVITAAEVFVSITCLEFSYTQAPKKMKSLIMGLFLASVSIGNLFTAVVNSQIIVETEVEADLAGTGSLDVDVSTNTTYALTCTAGDDSSTNEASVSIIRPLATELTPEQGAWVDSAYAAAHELMYGYPLPSITSFSVQGVEDNGWDSVVVPAGTEVTFEWESVNTDRCAIRPGEDVPPSGTYTTTPEETTTYQLACRPDWRLREETRTVSIEVTEGVVVGFLNPNRPEVNRDDSVTLSWDSQEAETCTMSAITNRLEGAAYYRFFAWAMLGTAVIFVFVALMYPEKTYIQDEKPAEDQ